MNNGVIHKKTHNFSRKLLSHGLFKDSSIIAATKAAKRESQEAAMIVKKDKFKPMDNLISEFNDEIRRIEAMKDEMLAKQKEMASKALRLLSAVTVQCWFRCCRAKVVLRRRKAGRFIAECVRFVLRFRRRWRAAQALRRSMRTFALRAATRRKILRRRAIQRITRFVRHRLRMKHLASCLRVAWGVRAVLDRALLFGSRRAYHKLMGRTEGYVSPDCTLVRFYRNFVRISRQKLLEGFAGRQVFFCLAHAYPRTFDSPAVNPDNSNGEESGEPTFPNENPVIEYVRAQVAQKLEPSTLVEGALSLAPTEDSPMSKCPSSKSPFSYTTNNRRQIGRSPVPSPAAGPSPRTLGDLEDSSLSPKNTTNVSPKGRRARRGILQISFPRTQHSKNPQQPEELTQEQLETRTREFMRTYHLPPCLVGGGRPRTFAEVVELVLDLKRAAENSPTHLDTDRLPPLGHPALDSHKRRRLLQHALASGRRGGEAQPEGDESWMASVRSAAAAFTSSRVVANAHFGRKGKGKRGLGLRGSYDSALPQLLANKNAQKKEGKMKLTRNQGTRGSGGQELYDVDVTRERATRKSYSFSASSYPQDPSIQLGSELKSSGGADSKVSFGQTTEKNSFQSQLSSSRDEQDRLMIDPTPPDSLRRSFVRSGSQVQPGRRVISPRDTPTVVAFGRTMFPTTNDSPSPPRRQSQQGSGASADREDQGTKTSVKMTREEEKKSSTRQTQHQDVSAVNKDGKQKTKSIKLMKRNVDLIANERLIQQKDKDGSGKKRSTRTVPPPTDSRRSTGRSVSVGSNGSVNGSIQEDAMLVAARLAAVVKASAPVSPPPSLRQNLAKR